MLYIWKIKIILIVWLLLPVNTGILLASELHSKNTRNASNSVTNFVTPSGNIYCALVGEGKNALRCEIRSMLNPLPSQPYSGYCKFDWGAGFLLIQRRKPKILCISDTIGSSSNTLSYGSTWTHSGFKCVSKIAGLTCHNFSKNGFFISRNKWRMF
jgi:hypothetical protein